MNRKRLSKDQRSSSDIITSLPQPIIETVLCFLPIEEAARTSILAKEWRYKWTTIPKLVFDESTVKRSTEEKQTRCKLFDAIYQVLLLRQSPVHEFTLSIDSTSGYWFRIDQIILHLARNHVVKKLTLDFYDINVSYDLPLSTYSLHHLTDLSLAYCTIDREPVVIGNGNLTSLYLKLVLISKKCLLHLLSNSPSLKSLSLFIIYESFLDEEYPNFVELFERLPAIEHLTTRGDFISLLVVDSVPQEIPVSLIHLKYLSIGKLSFGTINGLVFLGVMMKCSPNLKKIKLKINKNDHSAALDPDELEEYSLILEEYSDVWLEHLDELEIINFRNLKPELDLVKFILARSPNLKKVILLTCMHDKMKEFKMLKVLLRAPRVSPVGIIVENRFNDSEEDSEKGSDEDSEEETDDDD